MPRTSQSRFRRRSPTSTRSARRKSRCRGHAERFFRKGFRVFSRGCRPTSWWAHSLSRRRSRSRSRRRPGEPPSRRGRHVGRRGRAHQPIAKRDAHRARASQIRPPTLFGQILPLRKRRPRRAHQLLRQLSLVRRRQDQRLLRNQHNRRGPRLGASRSRRYGPIRQRPGASRARLPKGIAAVR